MQYDPLLHPLRCVFLNPPMQNGLFLTVVTVVYVLVNKFLLWR